MPKITDIKCIQTRADGIGYLSKCSQINPGFMAFVRPPTDATPKPYNTP